jgi:hypothetical protein
MYLNFVGLPPPRPSALVWGAPAPRDPQPGRQPPANAVVLGAASLPNRGVWGAGAQVHMQDSWSSLMAPTVQIK